MTGVAERGVALQSVNDAVHVEDRRRNPVGRIDYRGVAIRAFQPECRDMVGMFPSEAGGISSNVVTGAAGSL